MRFIEHIEAENIPEAWFNTFLAIEGALQPRIFNDDASWYLPFVVINIKHPTVKPLTPVLQDIPLGVTDDDVYEYFNSVIMNDDYYPSEDGSVMYGNRICKDIGDGVHQLDLFCDLFEDNHISPNLTLQIAEINDISLYNPPKLRSIQMVVHDNYANLIVHASNHNLWNEFLLDVGSMALLLKFVCSGSAVRIGSIVYIGSNLYISENRVDEIKINLHSAGQITP